MNHTTHDNILRVLSLEDSVLDFELISEYLVNAGYSLEIDRVENEKDFIDILHKKSYDIILADYNLPEFDAFKALGISKACCPDIPFICVSGSIGEILAIELLKQGAIDYVLKDRPERLPFAVKRALEEAKEKQSRFVAEKALLESEAKYRTIFENVQDVFYQTDINGVVQEISPSIKYFSEFSRDEILGHPVTELYYDADEREKLLKTIQEKGEIRDYIIRLKTKQGKLKYTSINARLIYDESGKPDHIDGAIRDITERILAEQELIKAKEKAEESDRLKTAFINNISHEVRTPLNGIMGFTGMLLNSDNTEEDKTLFTNIIRKSSQRLINTMTSYMDISMIVSGNMEIHHRNFNLRKLLEEVRDDFKEECENKGISLSMLQMTGNENTELKTDSEVIRKILGHLIDNAIKFTTKGSVTFGFRNSDGKSEFFVHDTGVGIDNLKKEIIFDSFMQADSSLTRGHEGSGLGLSIAGKLVNLLGSELKLESEINKGSLFSFNLPDEIITTASNPVTNENVIQAPDGQPLILVAEDDDFNFRFVDFVLRRAGFRVIRAENGVEAIEACRTNPDIGLVLMDMKMPVMGGLDATREIKGFLPHLPVFALTAYVIPAEERKAYECGCEAFISKPIDRKILLEIINKTLALN